MYLLHRNFFMLYLKSDTPLTAKMLTLKTLLILTVALFSQTLILAQASDAITASMYDVTYTTDMPSNNDSYIGIGTTLQKDNETLWFYIKDVVSMGPAAQAGIQQGDFMTRINGNTVFDMNLREAAAHLSGDAGTAVYLTIMRNHQFFTVDLKRAVVSF